jgi:sulfotransferase family protein
MSDSPALPISPPLVIGATGGSGTRVVARIAKNAEYYLGTNVNPAEDALEFGRFYDVWIDRFLDRGLFRAPLVSPPPQLEDEFRTVLSRHLAGFSMAQPDMGWGWKTPRSIYLLPFFHAEFPDLKFIHVLRDGRDMALSQNQNQLRKHGRRVLTWRQRWFASRAVRSILLWDRVNTQAAEYGETYLRHRYLRVRFEDLCFNPVETTAAILRFLDRTDDAEVIAQAEISPPATIGRWRAAPPALIARLERAASRSLRKFGYLAAGC